MAKVKDKKVAKSGKDDKKSAAPKTNADDGEPKQSIWRKLCCCIACFAWFKNIPIKMKVMLTGYVILFYMGLLMFSFGLANWRAKFKTPLTAFILVLGLVIVVLPFLLVFNPDNGLLPLRHPRCFRRLIPGVTALIPCFLVAWMTLGIYWLRQAYVKNQCTVKKRTVVEGIVTYMYHYKRNRVCDVSIAAIVFFTLGAAIGMFVVGHQSAPIVLKGYKIMGMIWGRLTYVPPKPPKRRRRLQDVLVDDNGESTTLDVASEDEDAEDDPNAVELMEPMNDMGEDEDEMEDGEDGGEDDSQDGDVEDNVTQHNAATGDTSTPRDTHQRRGGAGVMSDEDDEDDDMLSQADDIDAGDGSEEEEDDSNTNQKKKKK
eukprot:GILK01006916.1.p1 GENE.GILK01006916.1~~GILK01006916.1.p1  ORF type:complete len:379 (+),score=67.94 GILK01006916.1:22-1137(+)